MNMKKLMVALFAGFAGVMTVNADPMFYIGETGYDSWADVAKVLKAGDTVKVGTGAEISGMPASTTFDLCGNTLTVGGGWWYNSYTVIDSSVDGSGRFKLNGDGRNFSQGKLDLSALGKDQLEGGSLQINHADSLVKFPGDMTLEECKKFISSKATGTQIVVQGVTYKWGDSDWVADGPVATYSITITAPQNGTLETSVTNVVAAGTTVTVTATPATGCQLKSVTMNGAAITGNTFVMPAADVTLAATFEELPQPPAGLVWTKVEGVPSDWAPLANNLLAGKNGTTTGTISFLTPVANNIGKITDGVVPTNRKYSEMLGFAKDATVSWNFDAPKTLEKIRITTCDITDGRQYDDIHIADVLVKKSGADEWVSLGCGSVDWKGTDGQGIMLYVSLEDAATGYIAKDVIGLQIKFGQHNNVAQYYSEIEAVESASPVAPVQGTVFTIE